MANVLTLDAVRAEADKQFAPVKVDLGDGNQVALRSLLRLKKEDRQKVLSLIEKLREYDENREGITLDDLDKMAEDVTEVLRIVAGKDATRLLKALDGDFGLLLGVMKHWLEESQPGEAQNSPN